MRYCEQHPHSSMSRAIACYSKRVGKRADSKLVDAYPLPRRFVKYISPKKVKKEAFILFVFSEDINTIYR